MSERVLLSRLEMFLYVQVTSARLCTHPSASHSPAVICHLLIPLPTPPCRISGTRSLSSLRHASIPASKESPVCRQAASTVVMTSEFEKSNPFADELKATAKYIATRGKGILASDESNATTGKRCVDGVGG